MKKGLYFITGILYCSVISVVLFYSPHFDWLKGLLFLIAGAYISGRAYKSTEAACEYFYILITWIIFNAFKIKDPVLFFIPLITTVLISTSYHLKSRYFISRVWLLVIAWFIFTEKMPLGELNTSHFVVLGLTLIMLIIYTVTTLQRDGKMIVKADVIICSYSGNTYHFADAFLESLELKGVEVKKHRYHYYQEFNPELSGDALILAYPIFGLKPPAQLLSYLLFKLPRGKGRKAFIISTAAFGGPENGGILTWLIMVLKGYRVIGRSWAFYPVNVPSIRIGSKKLWASIDSLFPIKNTIEMQRIAGLNFSEGKHAGLPFILWLSPFTLIGMVIENKLVNKVYKNHVIRERCTSCGICARYCPSQRIELIDGYPKSKKCNCILCLGCVNNCPNNAMRIRFFAEFGNTYKPRWKKYIMTGKDHGDP